MVKNISLNRQEVETILEVFDIVNEEFEGPGEPYNGLLGKQIKIYKKLERALKPITVSSRKNKGRELQKYVCCKLAEILKIDYRQDDDNCEIHSREMGQSGTDIVLRGTAREIIKFDIECKNVEKLKLYEAIDQSRLNTQKGRDWLVVHKKNHNKPIAILDFEVFVNLLEGNIIYATSI